MTFLYSDFEIVESIAKGLEHYKIFDKQTNEYIPRYVPSPSGLFTLGIQWRKSTFSKVGLVTGTVLVRQGSEWDYHNTLLLQCLFVFNMNLKLLEWYKITEDESENYGLPDNDFTSMVKQYHLAVLDSV